MRRSLFARAWAIALFIAFSLASPALASIVDSAVGTGGTWVVTGSMRVARVSPMAAILPTGDVLAAGGFNSRATLASAELFDPLSGIWALTGAVDLGRYHAP